MRVGDTVWMPAHYGWLTRLWAPFRGRPLPPATPWQIVSVAGEPAEPGALFEIEEVHVTWVS